MTIRNGGALLIAVALMGGCVEEHEHSHSESFSRRDRGDFHGERTGGGGECDPYLGCEDEAPPMDLLDSSVPDAGSADAGSEDGPACDPYAGECEAEDPEPEPPLEPPVEPPSECDPYAGDCEPPVDPGPDPEPGEPEPSSEPQPCDPYAGECSSSN